MVTAFSFFFTPCIVILKQIWKISNQFRLSHNRNPKNSFPLYFILFCGSFSLYFPFTLSLLSFPPPSFFSLLPLSYTVPHLIFPSPLRSSPPLPSLLLLDRPLLLAVLCLQTESVGCRVELVLRAGTREMQELGGSLADLCETRLPCVCISSVKCGS